MRIVAQFFSQLLNKSSLTIKGFAKKLNKDQNAKVSDTTGDAICAAAHSKKYYSF
jgi:hypothetical protein